MAFTPFLPIVVCNYAMGVARLKQAKPAAHLVDGRGALKELPWQWETPPSSEAAQAKSVDLSKQLTPFTHLYPLPGTKGVSCAVMHARAL